MKPIKAVFLAPILSTIAATVVMGILSAEVSLPQFFGVLVLYSLVGSVFAIVSALLFGWPLSKLYKYLGLREWWQFCIGGIVSALPLWVIWFYPFNTEHWETYRVWTSLYFFSIGLLSGYLYWWFVVRMNPNKLNKQASTAGAP